MSITAIKTQSRGNDGAATETESITWKDTGCEKSLLNSYGIHRRRHSSSERSERFVRFEPNVRSERVRYFSERETNVQALKCLINLIAVNKLIVMHD